MRALPVFCAAVVVLLGAASPAAGDDVKHRVAVLSFDVTKKLLDEEPELGTSLAVLAAGALDEKHDVVDRARLTKAIDELKLTAPALRGDLETGVKLGKHLGTRFVLFGRASSFGTKLALHLKVLDVKGRRWGWSGYLTCDDLEDLPDRVPLLLEKAGLIGKKPAADVETFIERLSDADAGIRFTSAVALGKAKDGRAVAPLIEVLKDDGDTFVRRAAARSLGLMRAASAVPALIEALADREYFVGVSACKALLDITRHDFGLRPNMTEADAEKMMENAKAWLKEHEEELKLR
jgi:hypothetical protein